MRSFFLSVLLFFVSALLMACGPRNIDESKRKGAFERSDIAQNFSATLHKSTFSARKLLQFFVSYTTADSGYAMVGKIVVVEGENIYELGTSTVVGAASCDTEVEDLRDCKQLKLNLTKYGDYSFTYQHLRTYRGSWQDQPEEVAFREVRIIIGDQIQTDIIGDRPENVEGLDFFHLMKTQVYESEIGVWAPYLHEDEYVHMYVTTNASMAEDKDILESLCLSAVAHDVVADDCMLLELSFETE